MQETSPLWINEIHLRNFRAIKVLDLPLGRTTVLVGANGTGKSAVLEAVAILLSQVIWRIRKNPQKSRKIGANAIRNDADWSGIAAVAVCEDTEGVWGVSGRRNRNTKLPINPLREKHQTHFYDIIDSAWPLPGNEDVSFPVAVYYDVKRAVVDIPLRVQRQVGDDPLTAYDGALEPGGADFRGFFTWFRNREDLENEQRRDDPAYTDAALAAVRHAIEAFTGFYDLRVRRRPLRMTLKKQTGAEVTVQQLSDGEQCFLALIGDLARRLTVLNPDLENPLEGGGVVMIDEIELHLHPGWQRFILPRLEEIFPNCQFLVTTHSPQVLSHVRAGDVWVLHPDENGDITARQPELAYGADSSLLLQQVLGVAERNPEVQRELDALFRAIEDDDLESARREMDRMRADYGDLPPLTRAEAVLNRRARAG